MRCRSNGNSLCERVNAGCTTSLGNERKAFFEIFNTRGIKKHMVINACWSLRHACADCRCHHVSWRKVFLRMHTFHDALTRCIKKNCAFAANCFANKHLLLSRTCRVPQHRRVKLHELKIAQRKTCAQSKCMTVACYCRRVRGTCENLAIPTSCNHNSRCFH